MPGRLAGMSRCQALYYKGLPDRLKDEIAHLGKPSSLKALQDIVATLDQRYWECQTEINQDKKSASASTSIKTYIRLHI